MIICLFYFLLCFKRLGSEDEYQCPLEAAIDVDNQKMSDDLPNIWSHLKDGSLKPPNMEEIERSSRVIKRLQDAFPNKRAMLGLAPELVIVGTHVTTMNLLNSYDDAAADDEAENTLSKIQGYRKAVPDRDDECDSKIKVFRQPDYHDYDTTLGGSCKPKCNCNHNIHELASNLRNLFHKSIPKTPSETDKARSDVTRILSYHSNAEASIPSPIYDAVLDNRYDPHLMECISGLSYNSIGQKDIFEVNLDNVNIPLRVFVNTLYVNDEQKLKKREGFGVFANAFINEVDLKQQKVIFTTGNMVGFEEADGEEILRNLAKGK